MDDIDYHFNKVKCRKIEGMMPRLMEMVERDEYNEVMVLRKIVGDRGEEKAR